MAAMGRKGDLSAEKVLFQQKARLFSYGKAQFSTFPAHSGTEVVLVREGPRAGGGSSQRKKGSDYFTSPVKTMTLRDIK